VFDDGEIQIREFIARILAAHNLPTPAKSIPRRTAWIAGSMLDAAWTILRRPGQPPVSRLMVALNGGPFRVTDHKARHELGYTPVISRDDALTAISP
jgi:nucleoside-diphosphate-sugar epimerase